MERGTGDGVYVGESKENKVPTTDGLIEDCALGESITVNHG